MPQDRAQAVNEFDARQWMSRALVGIAFGGLGLGLFAWLNEMPQLARWMWIVGTVPVVVWLGISMTRALLAGRMGVDAVAFVSMSAALLLGENLAAVVVAVMYAGGNLLEDFAVSRARRDLNALIDRAPRLAHRVSGANVVDIQVDEVAVGDILLVRAGEVIPVDGNVHAAGAMIDEAALTGEAIPVARMAGDKVRSGTVNVGEAFELHATAPASESTYAAIVRMVTAAQAAKAPFIRIADRYALILLPVTLIVAGGAWLLTGDPVRGLAVLVASTPCPLILAAPVAFIGGVSRAARLGILIKGGGPLEALARIHTVMFDKTGTLTIGGARLVAVETAPGEDAETVLRLAACLEQASHHVVAAAIVSAARSRGLELEAAEQVREVIGAGLEGRVEGKFVRAGAFHLVFGHARPPDWATRALRRASWRSALSVFVSVDGRVLGAILLADELRTETPRAIKTLRAAGVSRIVMVTGDRAEAAEPIAAALDLDGVLAEREPGEKVHAVASEQKSHPTAMVGDGINDAPALAAADVGIAMGARGASASSEAADVVILEDRLDRVADAIVIAKRSRGIAVQSIIVGMALSGAAMLAAAFGWLSPVAAALTQEAIDVAVILNALRALGPGWGVARRKTMKPAVVQALREDHLALNASLDRLREIADALDEVSDEEAVSLIIEARDLVQERVVAHERRDEAKVYPSLSKYLGDGPGLSAMSRAHREILHLARLLSNLANGLDVAEADRYVVRDAQRTIEAIDSLVRIHNAQEEDIYEFASMQ